MNRLRELVAGYETKSQPLKAAEIYEKIIASSEADLAIYLNLVALYFVCNDGGYAAAHKLPEKFLTQAWQRVEELLDEAEQRFGWHPEIEFWRKYFKFIHLGEKFALEEYESLVKKGDTLVPYLYLYVFTGPSGRKKYALQANQLLQQVNKGATEKERYIKSVLEATIQRGK